METVVKLQDDFKTCVDMLGGNEPSDRFWGGEGQCLSLSVASRTQWSSCCIGGYVELHKGSNYHGHFSLSVMTPSANYTVYPFLILKYCVFL